MYFFVDFLYCALLHWVTAFPQMNLYSTNELDANNSGIVFQHDCFHIPASVKKDSKTHLIIHYCLTEWPLEWTIEENSIDKKLTFADLYKQNITTEQLYLWSAPLDVMEHYEYYLNHLSNANQSAALAKQVFYNCTSPRFGTSCQYSFDSYIVKTNDSTLYEVIHEFYQQDYNPENLTCYMHLACNRGSKSICLDWSEICDGTVDCQDRVDEGSCWELKISHCAQDEYECANKQCISQSFLHDGPHSFECLDATDEYLKIRTNNFGLNQVVFGEPAFEEEDIICPIRYDSPSNLFRLTSSCTSKRNQLLGQLLFDSAPALITNDCWIAVICQLNIIQLPNQQCYSHCSGFTCSNIINHTCPDMINVPAGAVLFGHIFFVYTKQDLLDPLFRMLPPRYVCYNDQFCDGFYPNKSLLSFDTSTCRHPVDFPLDFGRPPPKHTWLNKYVLPLYQKLSHCNKINHNYSSSCNNVTMYQCMNSSKCIPKYRLCNFVADCDYSDDEQCSSINGSCLLYGLDDLFKCNTQNWCISPALVQDRECHCSTDEIGVCEDEQISLLYSRSQISFPTICDGFTELTPIIINGRNETDETECEYWQCNNTYTRCDGFWNCFNGADEVGCHALSTLLLFNCTDEYQHICVSPKTNQLTCLPLAKANDGRIDCAGGTDEPQLCRSLDHHPSFTNFYCRTNLGEYCVAYKHLCPLNNYEINADEKFCYTSPDMMQKRNIRKEAYGSRPSGVENFLCTREIDVKKPKIKYFSLGKLTDSIDQMALQQTNDMIFDSPIRQINAHQQRQRCQRGLPLQVWFNTKRNLSIETCLCPPSFYGNACQYQNQRVSLTLRIQTYSDSRRTVFTLIISLIDDSVERNIHSYHQLTYLYIRDCQTKFNIYLLYSSRPKNLTKNYSIHIDIYEKISWIYRGSYLVAINYPFLPVHRVAKELYIPRSRGNLQHCSDYQCVHGQRIKYVETSHDVCFCQCDSGWYGKYCTLSYVSGCSSDSRSIGITVTNRSICICPLHKWGSRCLLNNQICFANRTATCQNNGQCIPNDDSVSFGKEYSCICSQGFTGERCETEDNKLILSFHKDIVLPQTVLIHFIRVMDNGPPENGSTFKTILTYQNAITVRWSRPFHVAFLDLFNRNYYLVTVQKHYKPMSTVVRTINPIDRCEHISQVLNKTILELHPLRRIKYYQLPCEQHSPVLSCFYDDKHICLCSDHNHRRSTNCFEFNHHSEHTCLGQSTCEHGAHCVQDRAICPQTSVCICPKCFYGTLCQFSSNLFDLSFDVILGYHIQPNIPLIYQPSIVQFSMILVTILILFGIVNSILCIITFENKDLRQTGSGIYLLSSSILSLFTLIIFALKYGILIIAQMTYIENRPFLSLQCISIDFLLRVGLTLDQWLNSFVGVDRAITVIKGTSFDKKNSRKMAKYFTFVGIIMAISTTIHDPLHRQLTDEDGDGINERRIWCTLKFSNSLRTFNLFIVMFHFFLPFFLNVISAVIIIIMTTRQRTTVQKQQSYQNQLRIQLKHYNHLLTAPCLLIILALPRLIISFVGGCMKSTSSSWLFLIGYLISFTPTMLIFFIFILPSQTYRVVLKNTIKRYRQNIRTRLHLHP